MKRKCVWAMLLAALLIMTACENIADGAHRPTEPGGEQNNPDDETLPGYDLDDGQGDAAEVDPEDSAATGGGAHAEENDEGDFSGGEVNPADDENQCLPGQPEPMMFVLEEMAAALEEAKTYSAEEADVRKFPYPYKAMLCITSDCDSTKIESFENMHRFLNTLEETCYGKGLGLDISDSFFLYNGSDNIEAQGTMTYCNILNPYAMQDSELIIKYYECGWIDSLHSFGDFSRYSGTKFTRELAEEGWKRLIKDGIVPSVWIDHGNSANVQNFGSYVNSGAAKYQSGDDPNSDYYHTDLTIPAGIRYAWYSRHSEVFGVTFPLKVKTLRDGQKVWSFERYNCVMEGKNVVFNWRPNQIHEQITAERLDKIEEKGQYTIIAQHLTMYQEGYAMQQADIDALRMLAARYYVDKSILVARTSRILDYAVMSKYIVMRIAKVEEYTCYELVGVDDPVTGMRDLRENEAKGLTIYCDEPENTVIIINGQAYYNDDLNYNDADDTGKRSVSIPWYGDDITDYTK